MLRCDIQGRRIRIQADKDLRTSGLPTSFFLRSHVYLLIYFYVNYRGKKSLSTGFDKFIEIGIRGGILSACRNQADWSMKENRRFVPEFEKFGNESSGRATRLQAVLELPLINFPQSKGD